VALAAIGKTELLARLKEVSDRRFGAAGMALPYDPVLYPISAAREKKQ
jgi:hypothetical protein